MTNNIMFKEFGIVKGVKIATFDGKDILKHRALLEFLDTIGLISMPQPEVKDPTGLTGTGFGHLPWPHTRFCVENSTPHLGEYVYTLNAAWKYVNLEPIPGVTERKVEKSMNEVLATHGTSAKPSREDRPRITFVLKPDPKEAPPRHHHITKPRVAVPNWHKLDAMATLPRSLAMELREQIWAPVKSDVVVADNAHAQPVANESPLPKMFLDLESMPPSTGFVMQDGTRVSSDVGHAYADGLVHKIEAALNWCRTEPFESRTGRMLNKQQGGAGAPAALTTEELAHVAEAEAKRKAAYEANMAAQRAKAASEDAARKKRATETRVAEAAKGEKPFSVSLPQVSKLKQEARRQRTDMEQYVHNVHVDPEQKALRSAAFDEKQQREHLEAEARKAREAAEAAANVVSAMEKAEAVAEHVVPGPATLESLFESVVGLS